MSSAPSSGQRVLLHVGLPKTGTTYLQDILAGHREALLAAGVSYPLEHPALMFHAAVEVRGSQEKFGLPTDRTAGAWAQLCAQARAHPGTTVISHEILGGAEPEEIDRALAGLGGQPVDVVITARDLARQATAHWQEEIKLGDTRSFAEFERDQFRADTAPGDPDRPHFWHAQDYRAALARWAAADRVRSAALVVCPPAGSHPRVLWERFAAALGVPAQIVAEGTETAANRSLGVAQIALLREVNTALGDRLDRAARQRVVKRYFAEQVLGSFQGAAPQAPAALQDRFRVVTESWLQEIESGGYPVYGELAELIPHGPPPGRRHPDNVAPGEVAEAAGDALADLLVRVAELQPAAAPGPAAPPAAHRTEARPSRWFGRRAGRSG